MPTPPAEKMAQALARLRQQRPLVHSVTNYVVMNNTANALLAVGASPIMAHAVEELDELAAICNTLAINIGTLDKSWVSSMKVALSAYAKLKKPVVLDPVGAGATRLRTQTCLDLLEQGGVSLIRGNASEIMALAGAAAQTKGVDSTNTTSEADGAARALIERYGLAVCVSGEVDRIYNRSGVYDIAAGHPMMPLVTGLGCTATVLCAAFMAVEPDAALASATAMAVLGLAGERAAAKAQGPGTLQLHILDELHGITPEELGKRFA